MSENDQNPKGEQPNAMPVLEGQFEPQAVLAVRAAVDGNSVLGVAQYDSTIFVENGANPQGEKIPDMNNPAAFYVRWLEIHHAELVKLAMGEYLQQQRIAALAAQVAVKEPKLQLVAPGGGRLQ